MLDLATLKIISTYLGWTLVFIGVTISIIGAVGCLRFPDLYTKLHALSVSDSLGVPISLTGIIFISGFNFFSLKIFFIIAILLCVNPFSTHALIRSGIKNKLSAIGKIKIPLQVDEVEE